MIFGDDVMVKGIGIDIIEISRIKKAVEKSDRFVKRLFTENEIEYFKSKNMKVESIAGNFAAKEAVVKALGTGLRGFKWTDIEVLRDELGKPVVYLHNGAKELATDRGINEVMLSISHCKEYAVANGVAV
tara:strand:+ start:132 stop:521 length:390 start_codon:yes stop_codon:yes gene_type:complete